MTDIKERTLTAHDLCDKCGVQAYFFVVFEYGELKFCFHHYKENESVLVDQAYYIVDESEVLLE